MATLEAPAGLPCPQSSTVTPEERRLLSEDGYGPRQARTIEVNERQLQTLQWMLNAEQSAIFKAWWRDTLIEGGSWFAAPATWPTPEGAVVKVRRFIGAPQWQYIAVGFWNVTITAEVRGSTALPFIPDPVTCDCSHVAWILDPDSDVINDDQLPALRGDFIIIDAPSLVSISGVDPLYGIYSLRIGHDEDLTVPVIDLTNAAVPIVDEWTISYSVKAPTGGGVVIFTLWKPDGEGGGQICRIEFRKHGGGDSQEFFYFDATTFNSGTYTDFAYETIYNCEFNSSAGRLRFFVNGVMLLDRSTGASRSVGHITCYAYAQSESTTLQLDEIRITNQAEHTSTYAVELPFCKCSYE